jgi:hypothetical protein
MVRIVGNIENGIPLYEDPYMEDNKILKGRKQDSDIIFFIANPKTSNILYKKFINKQRKKKLDKLNNA